MVEIGTVERALELARSGECQSVTQIIARLRREGRVEPEMHLDGASIRKQLNELLKSNRNNE